MNKIELRRLYLLKRSELTRDMVDDASMAIANNLLNLNIWEGDFYHIFLPIEGKNEINTEYVLHVLNGKDKNIVVPKANFENFSLIHFLLTDATRIEPNAYGIPEPADGIEIDPIKLDVVFVPLLAFDKDGNRIGYGKGFYDRFLSQCRPDTTIIGLSQFEAETSLIKDVSTTDIRLDLCVTPQKIYDFRL